MKKNNNNISQLISIYQKLDESSQGAVIGYCLGCYESQRQKECKSDIDMLIATFQYLNVNYQSSVLEYCRKQYIEMQRNTETSKQSANIKMAPKRK